MLSRWRRDKFATDDDEALERAFKEVLDACYAANITTVTFGGLSEWRSSPALCVCSPANQAGAVARTL